MARNQAETVSLFPSSVGREPAFPATRYQGSKTKIMQWLMESLDPLEFSTVLDLFGGTGAVSYGLKKAGKRVTYNDVLAFNHQVGTALIENATVRLRQETLCQVLSSASNADQTGFVAKTFKDIYFTHEENAWIDGAIRAIQSIADKYERALAYWALFQACIAKRPFNLFHRKNLYIRMADVERSFGNKSTWDKPFDDHFRAFAEEANNAVFDNGLSNRALWTDAADVEGDFDLVYLDPPYISAKGVPVDYHQFYHFLEGLVRYDQWP